MRTTLHKKLTLATFLILIGFASLYAQNEPKTIHFKPSSNESEINDENVTQEKIFKKDESYLWLGHGLVNIDIHSFDYRYYADWWFGDVLESSKSIGALFLKYEYGISKKSALGVNVSYFQNANSYSNTNDLLYTRETNYYSVSILARYNNHFYVDKSWDIYWGLGAGFKHYESESITIKENQLDPWTDYYSGRTFTMDLTIGARLKVSKGVCIYSEFGATKSLFQLGMTFDLKQE